MVSLEVAAKLRGGGRGLLAAEGRAAHGLGAGGCSGAPAVNATASLRFRGWSACRRDGEGPLGLILLGSTPDRPGEVVQLAFAGRAAADLPEALEDVTVERVAEGRYRIASGPREWMLDGVVHVHREFGKAFYKAVPPRLVPWRKRMFWRVALKLASVGFVQRLLRGR
jgi:hypothetical protein